VQNVHEIADRTLAVGMPPAYGNAGRYPKFSTFSQEEDGFQ